MKKCLLVGFLALFASQVNAAFIEGVTGADMAGMTVTAEFSNGSSETLVWSAMGTEAGGAISPGWGVMLSGDSFGQYDPGTNTYYGLWVISNATNFDIVELTLNGLAAGVVFDTEYGDVSANGSGAGREMVASNPLTFAVYAQQYMDELFSTMILANRTGVLVEAGLRAAFMTDTDLVVTETPVPAPAGMALLALGLLAMARKRQSV